MPLRFDSDTRQRLRRALLDKGMALATALTDLMAGKADKTRAAELPSAARKPGMTPIERLRAYLNHVEACRQRLDADDDSYGRCDVCGDDLGLTALQEMPWADRCRTCAEANYPG